MLVFISYAREDSDFANSVFKLLKNNGYTPWLDTKCLLPGHQWESQIESAISKSDAFICLLSEKSADKRGILQKEISLALNRIQYMLPADIFVVPLRLDGCEVPERLRSLQWQDISSNEWQINLLRALSERFRAKGAKASGVVVNYRVGEKHAKWCSASWEYPYLEGNLDADHLSHLNSALSGNVVSEALGVMSDAYLSVSEDELSWESFSACRVRYLSDRIISTERSSYFFMGGAHGNIAQEAATIDYKDLSDLAPTVVLADQDKIIRFVRQKIDADHNLNYSISSDINSEITMSLSKKSYFSDEGLTILFDPYQLFSFAHGPFQVSISAAELMAVGFTEVGIEKILPELMRSQKKQ